MEKKKILMLCDHPLVPSGVGTQAKYLIEGLLATGRYKFHVWGGAMKHPNYNVQRVEPEKYGDDWIITPVDGYGDKDRMRRTLQDEKPDAILLFTDPRFFTWIWEMEDEIRPLCPILYWHVWDNDPVPQYNKIFYDSTDYVVTLSKKTDALVRGTGYSDTVYIPHAVSPQLFKPLPEDQVMRFRQEHLGPHWDKEFLVFWNNRNARRKMTGDVIDSFAKFLRRVGEDKAALVMHTQVGDPEGQNILEVAKCCGVDRNLVVSEQRVPAEVINLFLNACDVTINIANNEGFGLGTLESLMSGTPIVVNMTGGLQYQIGGWWEGHNVDDQDFATELARKRWNRDGFEQFWGVPVFPATRSCTGSQQIPYIYDDRVAHEDVVEALLSMHRMGREKRKALGVKASKWARTMFDMDTMIQGWDRVIQEQLVRFASSARARVRSTVI